MVPVVALAGALAASRARAAAPAAGSPAGSAGEAGDRPRPRTPDATGLPALLGPIGLFDISTAEVGRVHQLRVGLHAGYFSATSLLVAGDSDQRLRGELAVGFTPLRHLELFGALLDASNRNTRVRSTADRDPEVLRSLGDLVVGVKGVYPASKVAALGFELGVKLLAGVSDLAFSASSTSVWLGPLLTVDLRHAARPLPLRFHLAASYYADNSANLRDLSGVSASTREVTLFGYGVAPSRLRGAAAADVPLGPGVSPVPVDAFVEYHFEYATGAADPAFAAYAPPACGAGGSPCLDNRDSQWVTLGVRPALFRGLTADLGVDLRLRSPGFPHGVPLPPYDVVAGLSLPLELDALGRPAIVTRTVEVEAPPRLGHVTGLVRRADSGAPVAGAIVAVAEHPRVDAATDGDGAFTTVELAPGPIELTVTAPGFEPARSTARVAAGQATAVSVALVAAPPRGRIHGRAVGRDGQGVAASFEIAGQGRGVIETRSDDSGGYALSLPVGGYSVRAEAPGLPVQETRISLGPNQDRTVDFVWRPLPTNPDVTLADGAVHLDRPIRFVGASDELTSEARGLLDGVADLLAAHPELPRVEVVAHWDPSLSKAAAEALTERQAAAVRAYLLARGIAGERVTARGVGSTQPLVPSLTPASRLRNRRVELKLE